MSYRKDRMVGLDKRYEVKIVIPPPSLVEVAHDRTRGMVNYFHAAISGAHWTLTNNYIERLAASAYLQGIKDAVDATIALDERGALHREAKP